MPITGTEVILGAAMKNAVDAVVASATAAHQPVDRDAMFKAMALAVITHFTANTLLAVTGVTVGAGVATGTIT